MDINDDMEIILVNDNPRRTERNNDINPISDMIFDGDGYNEDRMLTFSEKLTNGISNILDQEPEEEMQNNIGDISTTTLNGDDVRNKPLEVLGETRVLPIDDFMGGNVFSNQITANNFGNNILSSDDSDVSSDSDSDSDSDSYDSDSDSDEYIQVHVSTLGNRDIELDKLPEYIIELLDEITTYMSQNRNDEYIISAGALNIRTPVGKLEKIVRYIRNKETSNTFVDNGIFIIQIIALVVEETVSMMKLKNFNLTGWSSTFDISNRKTMNKLRPILTRIYNTNKIKYEKYFNPYSQLGMVLATSAFFHGKKLSAMKNAMTTNVEREVIDDINDEEIDIAYRGDYFEID